MRSINAALAAVAVAMTLITSAFASDTTDVMAVVNKFNDGMNKGDVKTAASTCAPQTFIIDEFAPNVWQSNDTCTDWANALDVYNKKNGITNEVVTLGKPRHVDVTSDRAYVVVPAYNVFKKNGKRVVAPGSIVTLALHKVESGWQITAWSWAQR